VWCQFCVFGVCGVSQGSFEGGEKYTEKSVTGKTIQKEE